MLQFFLEKKRSNDYTPLNDHKGEWDYFYEKTFKTSCQLTKLFVSAH